MARAEAHRPNRRRRIGQSCAQSAIGLLARARPGSLVWPHGFVRLGLAPIRGPFFSCGQRCGLVACVCMTELGAWSRICTMIPSSRCVRKHAFLWQAWLGHAVPCGAGECMTQCRSFALSVCPSSMNLLWCSCCGLLLGLLWAGGGAPRQLGLDACAGVRPCSPGQRAFGASVGRLLGQTNKTGSHT